jgi:hypothetical protein
MSSVALRAATQGCAARRGLMMAAAERARRECQGWKEAL